jgi:hypothetical protein
MMELQQKSDRRYVDVLSDNIFVSNTNINMQRNKDTSRYKSPDRETVFMEAMEKQPRDKKRRQRGDGYNESSKSHRSNNKELPIDNFGKMLGGKENKDKLFVKPGRKNRSKSKAGHYSSKTTPRSYSKTPDFYPVQSDLYIADEDQLNTMSNIGNGKTSSRAPSSFEDYNQKSRNGRQDHFNSNPYSLIEDEIDALSYQSPRSPTPVYSARKKRTVPTTGTQQQSTNSNTNQSVQPPSSKTQNVEVNAPHNKQIPPRRPSATLARAGSVSNMPQKPLPKISQPLDGLINHIIIPSTPAVTQTQLPPQNTQQQSIVPPQQQQLQQPPLNYKPISRKGNRSNLNPKQNFMTQLQNNNQQPIYHIPQQYDLRPNTSAGLYSDQNGMYYQANNISSMKAYQAVGAHDGRSGYW